MGEVARLWASAEAAYRSGQTQKAEEFARQILELDKRHVLALHLQRVIVNLGGDADREQALLETILGIDPNHPESLNGLASLLRKQGKVVEALAVCERAIAVRPQYANAHNNYGICLMQAGRYRDAAEALERTVSLSPNLVAGHLNLGYAMQKLGKKSRAAASFQRVAELAPHTAEATESLGHLFLQQRKREEATAQFRKLVALRPNSATAHLLLASTLEQQSSTAQESMKHVRIAVDLEPNSGSAHCALGFALSDRGDFDGAIASFHRSIELQPTQASAYLGLVTNRKITVEDRPLLERMIDLVQHPQLIDGDRAQLYTAMSKMYDDLGDYERAVASMDEANRLALAQEITAELSRSKLEFQNRIERDIRTFTPMFFGQHANMGSDAELPVLIVGLPRSGTSLLEQILSCHSGVAGAGELKYWSDLSARNRDGLMGLSRDRTAALDAANAYERLLRSIGPRAQRVIDKFPENIFELGMIHVLLPKARIIHCRRNPIDNCISLYLTPFRGKVPTFRTREDILVYYHQYKELADHWQAVLPSDCFLEVNYEDVVDDREATMRKVVEFCGLPWEDACLSHENNMRVVHTPSNWQARQAIYKTSVERWRRYEPWLGPFRNLLEKRTTTSNLPNLKTSRRLSLKEK
jgi:tetratricopeptide (TPR) repeat protein